MNAQGSKLKGIEKVKLLPVDGIILDLEDAVAPNNKVDARLTVQRMTQDRKQFTANHLTIRMNGLDTPWGHGDLQVISETSVDAVVVPKVSCAEDIVSVERLMQRYEANKDMKIWAMIETPQGVVNAPEIADASTRLSCLVMGTSDLTKELNCSTSIDRFALLPSLSLVLLAAKSRRKKVLDGVHLDLTDMDGFQRTCQQAKDMGFDGKTLIHPKTIEIVNTIFSPSEDEVALAKRIIEAYERSDDSIVVVDGKLIENLHVEAAKHIISLAKVEFKC